VAVVAVVVAAAAVVVYEEEGTPAQERRVLSGSSPCQTMPETSRRRRSEHLPS
jgi:hypothetical protein